MLAGCNGNTIPAQADMAASPDMTAPAPPPAAFRIEGVLDAAPGGPDETADGWLRTGDTAAVKWQAAAGATSYQVTLFQDDGTTPQCPAQDVQAPSATFSGCKLAEGARYRVGVVARNSGGATAASNNLLPFLVNDVVTGQAGPDVNDGARSGHFFPGSGALLGARFVVSECTNGNGRVLLWNSFPKAGQPADLVLGQPDVDSIVYTQPLSASSLSCPQSPSSDGTRLIVSDRYNNRLLIWNQLPTRSKQPADVVLGQPSFTVNTANNGGASASSLTENSSYTDGTRLFVTDRYNNRLLIWSSIPTSNQKAADVVLGQPGFTTADINPGGVSAKTLYQPIGSPHTDGTRLYVADSFNHRVLIWNSIPTSNQQPADVVLGQPNMTSNSANNGGVSARGMQLPASVFARGGKLFVADRLNHRVLIWNSIPTSNGQPADVVLGQPDMSAGNANSGGEISARTLFNPHSLIVDGTRLIVSDYYNHRFLIWRTIPTSNGQPADEVLGQPTFSTGMTWAPKAIDGKTLTVAAGVTTAGDRLLVSDRSLNRILIWSAAPRRGGEAASLVLGQPDLTSFVASAPSAQTLSAPSGLYSDGTRLYAADSSNHRVLVWSAIPTQSRRAADLVLGQPDFAASTANNGGVSAKSLNGPCAIHGDGKRLVVSDCAANHRVLIWNNGPTANQQPADLVLGQPDMASGINNNGGLSARSLNNPRGVRIDGQRLFVADAANHRVLIWNSFPTSNNQPADVVLGQVAFNAAEVLPVSKRALASPRDILVSNGRLFVADEELNRVVYWNSVPTQNGQEPDGVLGPADFTSGPAGKLTGLRFNGPAALAALGDTLYIADGNNGRVVGLPHPGVVP